MQGGVASSSGDLAVVYICVWTCALFESCAESCARSEVMTVRDDLSASQTLQIPYTAPYTRLKQLTSSELAASL